MESGGFSTSRLMRVRDVLSRHVASGALPGYVALVVRRGASRLFTEGSISFHDRTPMGRDTIFRITSMTKPIATVAALSLVEECRLRLDDPVDEYLPELAERQVLTRIDGPLDETEAAQRSITLRDLLTSRMGLGIVMAPPGTYPIQNAIDELGIIGFGPPDPTADLGPDEWMRRLGMLPLMHQPGEGWMYNTSFYVLGVLLARVTGKPVDAVLRERVLDPLDMRDTGFVVPAARLERLASCYLFNSDSESLELHDGQNGSAWSRPPTFLDASAGLVSTVDDYSHFAQMLLDCGTYEGKRILSRPAVEIMTANHLMPEQRAASAFINMLLDSRGWGFGVAVTTMRDDIGPSPGSYGWSGGFGTTWNNDPQEGLVTILMTQRMFDSESMLIHQDFQMLVYQALDD